MSCLWVTLRVVQCAGFWLHHVLVFDKRLDFVCTSVLVRAMEVVYVRMMD